MSRIGNCWYNWAAENFFKVLKLKMANYVLYQSALQVEIDVFEFIETWYNRTEIHAYLGSKTPEQYGKINYSISD